jgi:hypothetical protein
MSDSTDPGNSADPGWQAGPPSPFTPRPTPPGPPSGRGCSKPTLIGCGALLVLLGIGAILFMVKAPAILRWWFGKLEAQVMGQLPPDLSAAERERLHDAFAAVDRGVASGKLDAAGLQQMQKKLVQLGSKPNRQLTREDVRELTVALERLAGRAPSPAPPERPAPAPSP